MIARILSKAQDIAYASFYGALNAAESLAPSKKGRKYCNMCGRESALFYRHGIDSPAAVHIVGGGIRKECVCPRCHSLDRYRWVLYVIEHDTDIMTRPCKVLHIAAEAGVARKIRQTNPACEYLTGNIRPKPDDLRVDVTDMADFADGTFDYILMNHVLEHVPEEGKAMSEIKRCLKDDGMAVLSFPISLDQKTFEDKNITSELERLRRYGQRDHCRLYGYDAKERLEGYGFAVTARTVKNTLSKEEAERMSLIPDDTIYLCKKK